MTIQNLTKETYLQEIQKDVPILVDFWAPWCGYCRRIAPALEKVAEQWENKVTIAKLNIDEEASAAESAGIDVIPTLIVYRNGKILGALVAPDSKAKIDAFLQEILG